MPSPGPQIFGRIVEHGGDPLGGDPVGSAAHACQSVEAGRMLGGQHGVDVAGHCPRARALALG
jgi:hypothetical protein